MFVSTPTPQNSYVENLIPSVTTLGGGGLGNEISALYKGPQTALSPRPSREGTVEDGYLRGRGVHQTLNLPVP